MYLNQISLAHAMYKLQYFDVLGVGMGWDLLMKSWMTPANVGRLYFKFLTYRVVALPILYDVSMFTIIYYNIYRV